MVDAGLEVVPGRPQLVLEEETPPTQPMGRLTRLRAKQNTQEMRMERIQMSVGNQPDERQPPKCETHNRGAYSTMMMLLMLLVIGLWVVVIMMKRGCR